MPKGCYHSDSSLQKKRSHWLLDSFSGGKRNPSIPIYPHVSLGIPMDPQVSLGIPREPQGSLRIPNRDPWGTLGSPGDPQRDPWRPPGIPRTPEQPRVPQKAPRNPHSHAGSPATAPAIAFAPPRDASPRGTLGGGRPRKTYQAHPRTTPTSAGHTLEAHHEVFSGSGFRSVPTNSLTLFCD